MSVIDNERTKLANAWKIETMNENDVLFWFASVGMPAIVVLAGYVILKIHGRSLNR